MKCAHNEEWKPTELPHGIFASRLRGLAVEYHTAAEHLFGEDNRRSPPAYFCATHSMELSLKSYLAACALTRSEIKIAGHCLECLHALALKHELRMGDHNYGDVLHHLREYTVLNRYPDFDMDQILAPHHVLFTSAALLRATEPVVLSTFLTDAGRRGTYEVDVFSHGVERDN